MSISGKIYRGVALATVGLALVDWGFVMHTTRQEHHEQKVAAYNERERPMQLFALQLIIGAGYTCPQITGWTPYMWSDGYYVTCGKYKFEIQDHGGRWMVTPP